MRYFTVALLMGLSMPTDAEPFDASLKLERLTREAARRYKLDADLLMALFKHESRLRLDAISHTHDYGIGQVNKSTARSLGLSRRCLVKSLKCSINAAAWILASFKKQYQKREPATWVCRYNLGSRPLLGRRAELCHQYLNKVYKHLPGGLNVRF